jgi:hypothetical protein
MQGEEGTQVERVAKPIPGTMAFDPLNYEEREVPVSGTEQVGRTLAKGTFDALGAPTRVAGAAAGSMGYDGATGGDKPFLEAMADPETGLARPIREGAADMVAEGLAGGEDGQRGAGDYGKAAAGALGYVAGSVVEDPAALAFPVSSLGKTAAKVAGKGFRKVAAQADKLAGRAAEELSGVPEEALRAWGTKAGREAIKANAGKEFEIGQDLVKMIESFDDYLPEKEAVNRILERMPGITPEKALEALRQSKAATTLTPGKPAVVEVTTRREAPTAANLKPEDGPARNRSFDQLTGDPEFNIKQPQEAGREVSAIPTGDAANKKIDDLMGRLKLVAGEDVHTGKTGAIPAKKYRDIRASYDTEAKAAFKKDERELLERALLNARNQMAADLREAAKKSGDPEFVTLMESYADKLGKLERIKKFMGSNAETREFRAEGFISNLLNANKTAQQNLLKDLEDVFDADLMTRVQGAKWGKQIGKDGEPSLFPRQVTGRSDLGQTLIGLASFPFSSPTLASRVTLPALRKLATSSAPKDAVRLSKTLRELSLAAAEADAATAGAQLPNVIPFRLRDIAQGEDTKKPRRFSLRDLEAR